MTPEEAVALVAYVEECCPSQKISEYTPDAWHDVLHRWPLEDCRTAVAELLARGERWINVGDIAAEVRRVRALRLTDLDRATQPPRPVDESTYRNGMRLIAHRLASGDNHPPAFKAIDAAREDSIPPQQASNYQALRQAWEAERAAKREVARLEKETRLAAADAQRAARQRAEHAQAAMILLADDEALRAYQAARDELGPDATHDQIVSRAVELADHTKTKPAAGTAEGVRDGTARRGCPHGCELGTHEHPCPYATDDDRIGREPESEAS